MSNKIKKSLLVIALVALGALALSACATSTTAGVEFASVPVGKAYADGQEVYFTHTEASDQGVADKLTNMMKSPVLYVPSLAKVPAEARGNVFVFDNGVKGKGPFGFQRDIFQNPPNKPDYSPLRWLNVVHWTDESKAREMKSVDEVMAAEKAGEITIQQPGVVVNMPFITWDGGKR